MLLVVLSLSAVAQAQQTITLEIKDFATVPITGLPLGKTTNEMLLSRVNAIREEPGGADRLFVVDMNGPLYILDKKTRQFTKYLDFDGRDDRPGLFHRFYITSGYGNGINGFVFDPDYRRNGKFYTVHLEHCDMPVSNHARQPQSSRLEPDGLHDNRPRSPCPATSVGEGVIIEWIDTNTKNATFEGTAREILRTRLNTHGHPQGEIIFNPGARPGDPDWRVLYAEVGDSTSGESRIVAIRNNSQRLDNFVGKILRIIPDLNEHVSTSAVSENGRYRVPNDNPFVQTKGARPEIWAYGLRNPHRITWAVDPANPANNRLIANTVGYRTWEMVHIVERGSNHGWPYREGNQVLSPDQRSLGAAAGARQDSDADRRRDHRRCGHAEVSGHSIRPRRKRRRRDRKRLPLQRQADSGAARQIHLRRHHDRPVLVRRLQRDARGRCGRKAGDDGEVLRREVRVGQPARLARCRQADVRHACCRSTSSPTTTGAARKNGCRRGRRSPIRDGRMRAWPSTGAASCTSTARATG